MLSRSRIPAGAVHGREVDELSGEIGECRRCHCPRDIGGSLVGIELLLPLSIRVNQVPIFSQRMREVLHVLAQPTEGVAHCDQLGELPFVEWHYRARLVTW